MRYGEVYCEYKEVNAISPVSGTIDYSDGEREYSVVYGENEGKIIVEVREGNNVILTKYLSEEGFAEFAKSILITVLNALNNRMHLYCNDVSIDDNTGRGFEIEGSPREVMIRVYTEDDKSSWYKFSRFNRHLYWTLDKFVANISEHRDVLSHLKKYGDKGYWACDILDFVKYVTDTFECKDLKDQFIEEESYDYNNDSEEESN